MFDKDAEDKQIGVINNLDILYALSAQFAAMGDMISATNVDETLADKTFRTIGMMMVAMAKEMNCAVSVVDEGRPQS